MSNHHVEAIKELEISVEVLRCRVRVMLSMKILHFVKEGISAVIIKATFQLRKINEKKRQKKLHPHQYMKEEKKIVNVVNYLKKRLEFFCS